MLLGWEWGFARGLLGVCFWSGGVSGRILDIHRLGGFGMYGLSACFVRRSL